ncbi:helix-turn-helix domain-containing protein [Nocardia sp. CDC160]|uniref:helix-turn-helix domain-containing protein n=1 Tax=Nocardia sp. CDC160 TaxID=3112166 RepID=UPI002DBFDBDA|nr:helix-turn-helix domain-containing protein [Nocardia sp. CDC160]MEC3916979.1 helix-turn-helix domain-containing protein [Nocardia sp. CDC160]
MVGALDLIPEQPLVGMYMRYRRETLGFTQEEAARRMFISVSLYRKLENGERALSVERLEDWCAAMDAPLWLLEKMISLAMPKVARFARGAWPPQLREEDLEHLEALPFPAYFHSFPELDVLGANAAARQAFPWLIPASPGAERPVNLLETFMTVPEVQELVVNWETVVGRLLFTLRVMSPGVVAAERLAQILDTCRTNPEFERLWSSGISQELFNDSLVLVRHPLTGERMSFTIRSYNAFHPQDCDYQLFMLTPRAPTTPTIDPCAD